MPKRSKRKLKTQKKKFERTIEQRFKDFAEEVEDLAERFDFHVEKKSKKIESHWFGTLGFLWPLIGGVFGLLFLAFGIWLLSWVNFSLQNIFISTITNFLFINIHWFFAAFLLFGYGDYLSRRFTQEYWTISPIFVSMRVYFTIWFSVWILKLINLYAENEIIRVISNFLSLNIWGISVLFLVLGYVGIVLKKLL